jgi:hypothetical protein
MIEIDIVAAIDEVAFQMLGSEFGCIPKKSFLSFCFYICLLASYLPI